jgi:hypothetical protein
MEGWSNKDFLRALKATGAKSPPCPSCDRTDWHVINPRHLRDAQHLKDIEIEGMAQPIKLVSAFCGACGFVRTHTEHELLQAPNRPDLIE